MFKDKLRQKERLAEQISLLEQERDDADFGGYFDYAEILQKRINELETKFYEDE